MARLLGPIRSYCSVRDLPPLVNVVIPPNSGVPGDGVVAAQQVAPAHAAVFAFGWLAHSPPTPEVLEQAFRQQPNAGLRTPAPGNPRGGWITTIKDPCVLCDKTNGGLVVALCYAPDGDSGSAPLIVPSELAKGGLEEFRRGNPDAVRYEARRIDAGIEAELKKHKFLWARLTKEGGWIKVPPAPMGAG